MTLKLSILLLALFFGAVIPTTSTLASTVRADRLKIFIDVGHGGKDHGAKGLYDIRESELCLNIGKQVLADLKSEKKRLPRAIDLQLSRDEDVFLSLKERVNFANSWGADVFVSIHANSAPTPLAHGFEVYFLSAQASDEAARNLARAENQLETAQSITSAVQSILSDAQATNHIQASSRLAETLFQSLSEQITPNVRGVRQAPFTVLQGTEMPAVLVEVGYVNHPKDAVNLVKQDYLKQLSNAISTGIIEYLKQTTQSRRVGENNHDNQIRRKKT